MVRRVVRRPIRLLTPPSRRPPHVDGSLRMHSKREYVGDLFYWTVTDDLLARLAAWISVEDWVLILKGMRYIDFLCIALLIQEKYSHASDNISDVMPQFGQISSSSELLKYSRRSIRIESATNLNFSFLKKAT